MVKTFEEIFLSAGKALREQGYIPPKNHKFSRAGYEIRITDDGHLIGITEPEKGSESFLMKVTPESMARTSGIKPHPFEEQLGYLSSKSDIAKYDAYITQIREWAQSAYAHPYVDAVLKYLSQDSLAEDLVQETEKLLIDEEKQLVRFVVVMSDGEVHKTWESSEFAQAWNEYYDHVLCADKPAGLCYISGEVRPLASAWEKDLIKGVSNGKLISSADKVNYTYRGNMFLTTDDAFQAGDEEAGLMQAAIRYLFKVSPYAMYLGSANANADQMVMFNAASPADPVPFGEYSKPEGEEAENEDQRQTLRNAFLSNRTIADPNGQIVYAIIGSLSSAHGRISVKDYNVLSASEYASNITNWNDALSWERGYGDKHRIVPATINQLVSFSFGVVSNTGIKIPDRLRTKWTGRLIQLKIKGAKLPKEIIDGLMVKRKNIQLYDDNRYTIEWLTCAALHKYYKDWYGEEYHMCVEDRPTDRSYQYGRALAVFNRIENNILDRDKMRATNAVRMTALMAERPRETLAALQAKCYSVFFPKYARKGWFSSMSYYEELLNEIVLNIRACEQADPDAGLQPLDNTWIFGYHAQDRAITEHIKNLAEAKNDREKKGE